MAKKNELAGKVSEEKKVAEKTKPAAPKTEKAADSAKTKPAAAAPIKKAVAKKKARKNNNKKTGSPPKKPIAIATTTIEKGKLFIHPALPTGHQDSADCFKKMSDTLNSIHSTVIEKQQEAAVFAEKVFGEDGVVAEFSGYRQIIKDEAQLVTYESTIREIIKSSYQKVSAFYEEPVPYLGEVEAKSEPLAEEFKLPEAAKLINQVDAKTALRLMGFAREFVANSVINSLEDKDIFEREVLGENGYIAQAIAYKPLFENATAEEKEMYDTFYNDLVLQAKKVSDWRSIGVATDGGAAKAINESAIAASAAVISAATPTNKTLAGILAEKLANTLAVLKNHQSVRNLHIGQLKDFLTTNSGQGYVYTYNETDQKICLSFGNESAEAEFKI